MNETRLTDPPMTVDSLAQKLAEIQALGMGDATVLLPDGQAVNVVELVATGQKPAHFVVRNRQPPAQFQTKIK